MKHLTVQQLSASLDGALAGPPHELVVRHLAVCHECRDHQARLAKHDDALRRLLTQEPAEPFLDDLTQRTVGLIEAIAKGVPAPVMTTSVPLLHEEDPHAPAEPPPPPARPELGHAAELAKRAGWGLIGLKPASPAPEPDLEHGQRAQPAPEPHARPDAGGLAGRPGEESREPEPVDGPVFELPAWAREQSSETEEAAPRPRAATPPPPHVDAGDEDAGGDTHDALEQALRRLDPGARSEPSGSPEPELPGDETLIMRALEVARVLREWEEPSQGPDDALGRAAAGLRPSAAGEPEAEAAGPGRERYPEHPFAPPARTPEAVNTAEVQAAPAPEPGTRERREYERALVMAIASVGALLLIVLVMQLVPSAPVRASRQGMVTVLGMSVPRVQILKHGRAPDAPAPAGPPLRSAATPPPVDQPVAAPATTPGDSMTPAERAAAPAGQADWPLLCGQVVDAQGEPVAGARVTLARISFTLLADPQGRFCLSAPAGSQELRVEAPGYAARTEPATFAKDAPELRVRMQAAR